MEAESGHGPFLLDEQGQKRTPACNEIASVFLED
jgi:hypothetical protein